MIKGKKYSEFLAIYTQNISEIKSKLNRIIALRLTLIVLILGFLYVWLSLKNNYYCIGMVVGIAIFIVIVKRHNKVKYKLRLKRALRDINQDELNYLKTGNIAVNNGEEFNKIPSFYTRDLDVFGKKSLFQNLNRTATYIGYKTLAERFLNLLPKEKIVLHQNAVEELKPQLEFRQKVYATAKIIKDSKEKYQSLLDWVAQKEGQFSAFLSVAIYVLPILFWLSIFGQFFIENPWLSKITYLLFGVNLFLTLSQSKNIQKVIIKSDGIAEVMNNYALIFQQIENQKWQSEYLCELQSKLKKDNATLATKRLSVLFDNMSSFLNIAGAIIFNGLFLYHLLQLKALYQWKNQYQDKIKNWLNVVGEVETLNSLANFAYNNPEFPFPKLNKEGVIEFKNMGHPLLSQAQRVDNSISFKEHPFVILTGSNMAGKSTFLRALGVNMVLMQMGSVICVESANISPLKILISMRLDDSLQESESYFFAEIKKLKAIIEISEKEPCFVLLDEVLRGTNSEDKRKGTTGIIEKIIAQKSTGVIATHDLEVCKITAKYPDYLSNKFFEVQIENNELKFDYKLQEGICRNQSATFLMQKMKIINA